MAITEKITNLARTTLSASMADGTGTSLTVTSASLFPSSGQFRIRIQDEIMLVTAGAGTTSWTVTRAQEGTTGVSHAGGSMVYLVITAGTLDHLISNHEHSGGTEGIQISGSIFGHGEDGNVTISGTTTLTRDMFYNNLTINSSQLLNTAGYNVHVAGTLTMNSGSVIHNDGGNGTAGTNGTTTSTSNGGAAGTAAGTGGGRWTTVTAGNGSNGTPNVGGDTGVAGGSSHTNAWVAYSTKGGGGGGNGTSSGNGGYGATGSSTAATWPWKFPFNLLQWTLDTAGSKVLQGSNSNGSGGGGGGVSGSYGGGGGGAGAPGGPVVVFARAFASTAGTIRSLGGNGANGGNGYASLQSGGGGGGSGGNGGLVYLVYGAGTNLPTISVAGGSLGNGGNKGNGTCGNGQAGQAGNSGVSYTYKLPA